MNAKTTGPTAAIPSAPFHPESSRSPRRIPHVPCSKVEVCILQTVLIRGRRSARGCYGKSNFDSVKSVPSVAIVPHPSSIPSLVASPSPCDEGAGRGLGRGAPELSSEPAQSSKLGVGNSMFALSHPCLIGKSNIDSVASVAHSLRLMERFPRAHQKPVSKRAQSCQQVPWSRFGTLLARGSACSLASRVEKPSGLASL